ncbi:MAG: sigma-70 family RNA polymerase sigma factor [Bryobacteraceae bacterium]
MNSQPGEITQLLLEWKQGKPGAFDRLMPLVYPHLCQLAAAYIRGERDPGVLQATALVHEVYLRLIGLRRPDWVDRAHFYTFSAKVMRRILTEHARSNVRQKRGGGAEHVALHDQIPWLQVGDESTIELNRALDELEAIDPQQVHLVELRFFLGCTAEETGEILRISTATVNREVKFARSWLYRRMSGGRNRPRGQM